MADVQAGYAIPVDQLAPRGHDRHLIGAFGHQALANPAA